MGGVHFLRVDSMLGSLAPAFAAVPVVAEASSNRRGRGSRSGSGSVSGSGSGSGVGVDSGGAPPTYFASLSLSEVFATNLTDLPCSRKPANVHGDNARVSR